MKDKHPSYWIGKPCSCGSPVMRLIKWDIHMNKYVIRMTQPTCEHITDNSSFRKVEQKDVDEYLRRYKLGEPSQ